jgi:K+-sensing histidine kinase KdpD
MTAVQETIKKPFHKYLKGILIIDAQASSKSQLKNHFQEFNCETFATSSLNKAAQIIEKEKINVFLFSLPFPQEQLITFFQDLQTDHPSVNGFILGTQTQLNHLEAIPFQNISSYIVKGPSNFNLLDQLLKRSLEKEEYSIQLKQKNKNLSWLLEQEKQKTVRLEEENDNKSQFIKQLSSNLLPPLTHLIQFADIGLERVKRKELSLAGDYLAEIKLIGQELTVYINDLLEITKLSTGESQFDIEDVDVKEFFKTIKNRFQSIADNSKISLNFNIKMKTPYIHADYNKLFKVIIILMRNSFRYVPEGGKIDIKITQEDHTCFIQLKDNGPGIPLNKRKSLFNMYGQNRVQNRMGIMGFGLSICKELIVRQNGDIWLEDDEKEGCCFFLSLPVADSLFD